MQYWIVQGNPDRYDIRSALAHLPEIRWRVPQHTAKIRPGDVVLIWESGKNAGFVGTGRVTSYPKKAATPRQEEQFTKDLSVEPSIATRATISVRPVEFVSKNEVARVSEMSDHPIITAPMGTVFPLEPEQLRALELAFPSLGETPETEDVPELGDWPAAFEWSDRRKSVYPLPGGYKSYGDTLARMLAYVGDVQPTQSELETWIQSAFDVSVNRARYAVGFLQRVGLFGGRASQVELPPEAEYWLANRDAKFLVALLHSRVQLVGELLEFLDVPRSTSDLLAYANDQYGMGWKSRAQIDRRWYWLLGFGAAETDDDGLLIRTTLGSEVIRNLAIEPARPILVESIPQAKSRLTPVASPPTADRSDTQSPTGEDALAEDLVAAASYTADPSRLERLTTEAFAFLGFDSSWLGGSGKTDVLLVAPLGPREGYRVIVDCKTTSHDGVQDQQVDWVTLADHRSQHDADYVALVAPAFKGVRIRQRAADHGVMLVDVETLASVLRQHAATPLDLDTYRTLFEPDAEHEPFAVVADASEDLARWQLLVGLTVRILRELESDEGWLGAKDLYWNLKRRMVEEEPFTVAEIETALAALSSPVIGAIRTNGAGFKSLGSESTTRLRFLGLAVTVNQLDLR